MTATSSSVNTRNRAVHRTQLNNGICVLVTENPTADIVSARLFLRAGSRWETREQAGLAHMVSSVLTKGSQRYSSQDIAAQVESIGASLGTDSAADYFLVSVKTVSADFEEILGLAGEVMRHPTFPAHEVELERKLTLQSIKSQKEQPFNVAMGNLREVMYGDHPYAMSDLGTEESIQRLTRDDLVAFHQRFFRPDQLVISIAGRITIKRAVALVEQVFGDWAVTTAAPIAPELSANTKPQCVITPQPTQQSIVMLGYMAPNAPQKHDSTTAEDYMALKLLNTYLGSGLSSRLFVELREKRGLAYEVSSFYPSRLDPTHFVVYMGTAPGNTQTAYDRLKAEVDRLVNQTLSDTELQIAKDKLLGQYALSKQTNAQLANTFGWYESLGFGVEFDRTFPEQIANVTAAQAQAAAEKYFGQPYVSVLGPAEVVGMLLFG